MRNRITGRILVVVTALAVMSACAQEELRPYPRLTFDHLAPIKLDVATVETVTRYRPPSAPPNVDHRFPIPPQEAMRRWEAHRLKASGQPDTARFTIIEASVTEEHLKTDKGLLDPIKIEPAARYSATLEAQLEIIDPSGRRAKGASARVSRTRSLKEGLTADDRDRAWIEFTNAVMNDFDASMVEAIRKYLADWVVQGR